MGKPRLRDHRMGETWIFAENARCVTRSSSRRMESREMRILDGRYDTGKSHLRWNAAQNRVVSRRFRWAACVQDRRPLHTSGSDIIWDCHLSDLLPVSVLPCLILPRLDQEALWDMIPRLNKGKEIAKIIKIKTCIS